MERLSRDQEVKLMKEKGLKNQKELEEWYRGREESIRKIQEGIRRFFGIQASGGSHRQV